MNPDELDMAGGAGNKRAIQTGLEIERTKLSAALTEDLTRSRIEANAGGGLWLRS
jgi:hypothetical protein